jgi:hypothetical protein
LEKIIKLAISKKKFFTFIILFTFLYNSTTKALTNNVIATVDNTIITELDVKKEIEFIKFINKSEIDINSIKVKKEITEILIDRKIKKIEVDNAKILINEKEIENYFNNYLINQKIDNEILNKFYNSQRIEDDYLKNVIDIDLRWIKLIRQIYENRININLTEVNEEIKKESHKNEDNEKLKNEIIASEKNKLLSKFSSIHLEYSKKKYLIKYL